MCFFCVIQLDHVEGHLRCFHTLAIINSAVVNIGYMYLFEVTFSSFLDVCPGVELLDYVVTLVFVFSLVC